MWGNDIRSVRESKWGGCVTNGDDADRVYEAKWEGEMFLFVDNSLQTAPHTMMLLREEAITLREALDAFIEGRS